RHALGHFLSDVLLRLGLLGTIVGFILMLIPVAEAQQFDSAVMQRLLVAMSGGMAVALYTTLAGLIGSTLLRMQYHLLDSAVADMTTRLAMHIHSNASPQR
ncbi:MAG: MotA/TolQ/ExbB proton channel family protein, partial [Proteobacteria bacterium]|nr:MotA/TolQ/ExbB proton channel family protein [Pseudomonadota bacterium]